MSIWSLIYWDIVKSPGNLMRTKRGLGNRMRIDHVLNPRTVWTTRCKIDLAEVLLHKGINNSLI